MKKYIINEEEFNYWCNYVYDCSKKDLTSNYIWHKLNLFLKNKQPVEEIASGEVTAYGDDEAWAYIGDKNIDCLISDKYNGKNIKIYIEVVK